MKWCRFQVGPHVSHGIVEDDRVIEVSGSPFAEHAVTKTSHDLVLANILAGPLMSLAPLLSELVKPGGTLVMSGLLMHQVDAVTAHYPRFDFGPTRERDSWALVEGTRTGG